MDINKARAAMVGAPHATIDIVASDTEPGVILVTFTQGDLNIPVRLAGQAAQQFAEAFGRAYVTAFADVVPTAMREATNQDIAALRATRANGGSRPLPPDIGQRFAHPFED